MAKSIGVSYSAAAATLYAMIRNTDQEVWNGAAFEAYVTANLGNYDLPMTEQGSASKFYAVAFPALVAGVYNIVVKLQAGGSPAEADTTVAVGTDGWDGSDFLTYANVAKFAGTAITSAAGIPEVKVASIAANALTAAAINADAITAAKLHADVTTELQAGLATAAALATVDGIVDDILLDTAEIGTAGAGLTNINLPNQTMDIVGNITGNLSGSVGSVTGGATASAVSTLQTSVDDLPTNAELATALGTADDATLAQVALVKAKTDLIPASPAAVGDIPTAAQNADALLARDIGSGSGAGTLNERTVRAALRFNRNKFTIAGGVLTVYKEDDATIAFTAAITTTAGDPVSASDPV